MEPVRSRRGKLCSSDVRHPLGLTFLFPHYCDRGTLDGLAISNLSSAVSIGNLLLGITLHFLVSYIL